MGKHDSGDWLKALTIVGRILVFVPMGIGVITLLVSLLGDNKTSDYEDLFAGSIMLFLCGLVTLLYVAIKKFQQGYRGELDKRDSGG